MVTITMVGKGMKNKRQPKSYTMLILTIALGIAVLGGGSIYALSYFGLLNEFSDGERLDFTPPKQSYTINFSDGMSSKELP